MSVWNEEVAKRLGTKTHELSEMEEIQKKFQQYVYTYT
jgi:hypothetical protein